MKLMRSLTVLLLLIAFIGGIAMVKAETAKKEAPKPAPYKAKDYSSLLGMKGFSDTLLNNHFKLYQGYVANSNALAEKLSKMEGGTPEYAELKRRFGWEWNGMRLHEYYFENLGGKKPLDEKSPLHKALVKEFGSFDAWKNDFIAAGKMRGIGWVILYQDADSGRLFNMWINEHDVGHPAGANPVLIMDVFEHAFITDYQLDRAKYIEAFFANIKWETAAKRFIAK